MGGWLHFVTEKRGLGVVPTLPGPFSLYQILQSTHRGPVCKLSYCYTMLLAKGRWRLVAVE